MSEGLDMRVKKSFLTNKIGPLPTWAWMLIGLGIAITISVVRSDKAGSDKAASEQSSGTLYGGDTGSTVQEIGGSQRPPVVTQLFNTSIFQPPSGGRTTPPACAPPPQAPCAGPTCPSLPADPGCSGLWVKIASSHGGGAQAWRSSLAGIARKYGLSVAQIWGDPQNAALRQRRKDPRQLRAGDTVWIATPTGPPAPVPSPRGGHDRGRH